MPLGFRILPQRRAVAATMVERFRALPTANVSDVMSRLFAAVETILAATEKKQAAERVQAADIENGQYDNAWVDAALRRLGCEGIA